MTNASHPEGRYALDLNSSAYADPYVCDTPYLPSKQHAEKMADDLLPILDAAGKWTILLRASEEVSLAKECKARGWQNGNVWEQVGIEPGDYDALITRIDAQPGPSVDTDWRSYAAVTSEARTDSDEPAYEENYRL